MTRKDYKLIAAALKLAYSSPSLQGVRSAMYHIAKALQEDNPKFNPEKFAAACGMEEDYDA